MEETKEVPAKASYEQLEQLVVKLQQRLTMTEMKLRNIDFASLRLTWLFKVIENKDMFSVEFLNKCTEEIENILTIETAEEEADSPKD